MELGISGRRALVTGASRGIGRATARCLAAAGVRVAIVARSSSELDNLVEEMGGAEAGHVAYAMDIEPEGAPAELVRRMGSSDLGTVDIVVHNMGGTLDVNDALCGLSDWRRVWRFNMEVALELNGFLIPPMRERKWGRIVHVSSISSMENHGPVAYCSVKAAVTAYARSMGRYLAPDGVVMTAVLPGAVLTEDGYWAKAQEERPRHVRKYLEDRMAIHRFGSPDEIAPAVAFLCSEKASFFVGSVVPIDGGQGRSFFGL